MYYFCSRKSSLKNRCLGGGIGRRVGLKNRWGNARAGSIPALGTNQIKSQVVDYQCLRFFFLFFSPFVKTHDEQIGQTTMSSLRQVPDFLHGYIGALLTNKYPPHSRLVVYCAGRPNWNECRIISQNATTCYSCAQYRYLLLLWTNNTQILHRHKASLCLFGRWKTKQDPYLILHLNKGVYVIDFAIILSMVQN